MNEDKILIWYLPCGGAWQTIGRRNRGQDRDGRPWRSARCRRERGRLATLTTWGRASHRHGNRWLNTGRREIAPESSTSLFPVVEFHCEKGINIFIRWTNIRLNSELLRFRPIKKRPFRQLGWLNRGKKKSRDINNLSKTQLQCWEAIKSALLYLIHQHNRFKFDLTDGNTNRLEGGVAINSKISSAID